MKVTSVRSALLHYFYFLPENFLPETAPRALAFCALAFSTLYYPAVALAERKEKFNGISPSLANHAPPEQREAVASQLQMLNTYFMKYRNSDKEAKARKMKPVGLYVRGEEGKEFPDPQMLRTRTNDFADALISKLSAVVEAAYKHSQPSPTPTPIPVRTCPNSETKKTAVKKGKGRGKSKQKPYYDVLIIRKENLPEEPIKAFGKRTIIKPYDRSGNDLYSTALQYASQFVPCVPYRVRITDKSHYIHLGEDALRNFDANVDGPGKLLPEVKQLVRQKGW